MSECPTPTPTIRGAAGPWPQQFTWAGAALVLGTGGVYAPGAQCLDVAGSTAGVTLGTYNCNLQAANQQFTLDCRGMCASVCAHVSPWDIRWCEPSRVA